MSLFGVAAYPDIRTRLKAKTTGGAEQCSAPTTIFLESILHFPQRDGDLRAGITYPPSQIDRQIKFHFELIALRVLRPLQEIR
jgi:hypothetical protein